MTPPVPGQEVKRRVPMEELLYQLAERNGLEVFEVTKRWQIKREWSSNY